MTFTDYLPQSPFNFLEARSLLTQAKEDLKQEASQENEMVKVPGNLADALQMANTGSGANAQWLIRIHRKVSQIYGEKWTASF